MVWTEKIDDYFSIWARTHKSASKRTDYQGLKVLFKSDHIEESYTKKLRSYNKTNHVVS